MSQAQPVTANASFYNLKWQNQEIVQIHLTNCEAAKRILSRYVMVWTDGWLSSGNDAGGNYLFCTLAIKTNRVPHQHTEHHKWTLFMKRQSPSSVALMPEILNLSWRWLQILLSSGLCRLWFGREIQTLQKNMLLQSSEKKNRKKDLIYLSKRV
jgi:hypothetical protein